MKRLTLIICSGAVALLLFAVAVDSASADATYSYHLAPYQSTGWSPHANSWVTNISARPNPDTGYVAPTREGIRLICQNSDGSWYAVSSATVYRAVNYGRFNPANDPSWNAFGVFLGNYKYPGGCDTQAFVQNMDPSHDRVDYVQFNNAFGP